MSDSTFSVAGTPEPQSNRGVILEATRAELAERGYEGASIRSIARRAKVDPRLIRYYFPSKTALVVAAMNGCHIPERLASGSFVGIIGRIWRNAPDTWESFVTCGLSNEPEVREVVVDTMRSVLDVHGTADETVRLQMLLTIGHTVGGWLVTGGRAADVADRHIRELLLATVQQQVTELRDVVG
jgi:AcrR family transcriptional regulator